MRGCRVLRHVSPIALIATMAIAPATIGLAAGQRGPFDHEPRSVRSRDFDQRHLRLELDFDWQRQEIRGRAIHRLVPFDTLRKLVFDAAEMEIRGVALAAGKEGGKRPRLRFETRDGQLTVTLNRAYDPGETIRLAIDYVVREPQRGAHFVVPDPGDPDQPPMVWTQSEPEWARHWFPCLDSPADRLTSEILATVPGDFFVLSNGVLKGKRENKECKSHGIRLRCQINHGWVERLPSLRPSGNPVDCPVCSDSA